MSKELQIPFPDPIMISEYTDVRSVSLHYHRFVELVFIMEGGCDHTYLGRKMKLTAGDAFIIVPGESHSYDIHSHTHIVNCIFLIDFIKDQWSELKQVSGIYDFVVLEPLLRFEVNRNQILRLSPPVLAHAGYLLSLIGEESRTRAPGYLFAARTHLLSVLLLLGRQWEQTRTAPGPGIRKKQLVEKALLHIQQNLSQPLTIEGLAAVIPLSSDYFRRIFRQVTGMTPLRYINRLRVEKAKQLLSGTDWPVSRIGQAVGIDDIAYFSRLFSTLEGISPLQYRKTVLS